MTPSKFLTQGEIDAASQVHVNELNVQNQQQITWPANFVVARAYVDQLSRSQALSSKQVASLSKLMPGNNGSQASAKDLEKLNRMSAEIEAEAGSTKDAADAKRLHALANILKGPTA